MHSSKRTKQKNQVLYIHKYIVQKKNKDMNFIPSH